MKTAEVDKVARGHVWTGRQARARKLVDADGGLVDALHEVKRRAGLSVDRPIPIVVLPRPPSSLLSRAMKLAGGRSAQADGVLPAALRRVLGTIPPSLLEARSGEPMTRLPFRLELDQQD